MFQSKVTRSLKGRLLKLGLNPKPLQMNRKSQRNTYMQPCLGLGYNQTTNLAASEVAKRPIKVNIQLSLIPYNADHTDTFHRI